MTKSEYENKLFEALKQAESDNGLRIPILNRLPRMRIELSPTMQVPPEDAPTEVLEAWVESAKLSVASLSVIIGSSFPPSAVETLIHDLRMFLMLQGKL